MLIPLQKSWTLGIVCTILVWVSSKSQPWWPGGIVAWWFTWLLSYWLNISSKVHRCKKFWGFKGEIKSEWNNVLNNLHHMLSVSTLQGGWLPLWVQNRVPVIWSLLLHPVAMFNFFCSLVESQLPVLVGHPYILTIVSNFCILCFMCHSVFHASQPLFPLPLHPPLPQSPSCSSLPYPMVTSHHHHAIMSSAHPVVGRAWNKILQIQIIEIMN